MDAFSQPADRYQPSDRTQALELNPEDEGR
jgi:hypothetical protein